MESANGADGIGRTVRGRIRGGVVFTYVAVSFKPLGDGREGEHTVESQRATSLVPLSRVL